MLIVLMCSQTFRWVNYSSVCLLSGRSSISLLASEFNQMVSIGFGLIYFIIFTSGVVFDAVFYDDKVKEVKNMILGVSDYGL